MIIRGTLGNAPWDVLHQGLARHLPISIGTAVIAVSLLVLVLWIPLRELPGLGTIANTFLVGPVGGRRARRDRTGRPALGAGGAHPRVACCSTPSRPRCTSAASSARARVTV
jgi:hypothetical protein